MSIGVLVQVHGNSSGIFPLGSFAGATGISQQYFHSLGTGFIATSLTMGCWAANTGGPQSQLEMFFPNFSSEQFIASPLINHNGTWQVRTANLVGAPNIPNPYIIRQGDFFTVRLRVTDFTGNYNRPVYCSQAGSPPSYWGFWTLTGTVIQQPNSTNRTPTGTITSRTPTFSFQYVANGYPGASYRIRVRQGTTVIADTGPVSSTMSDQQTITRAYNSGNFPNMFTELQYGVSYNWQLEITNNQGVTQPYVQTNFSISPHAPTATISAPLTGLFDRTPQLVATPNDNLGHSITETYWQMRQGTTVIGESLPSVNNMSPTYDPSNVSFWKAGAQELEYGQTYNVRLQVKCSDNVWSSFITHTFAIGDYRPTVTYLQPAEKVDTLEPTIEATYSSVLSQSKTHHKFEIWDATATNLLAETEVISSSSSPFSQVYEDDSPWETYTALNWGTTYVAKALARDSDGIWSQDAGRTFKTNSAPLAPTNLQPDATEITITTPTLSATFNDPDIGDTPINMEVEMRDADDNSLVISRVEGGSGTSFQVFIPDGLEIDHSYQWRTRFEDQGGLWGAWSAWATFSIIEGATATFTHPVHNQILDSPLQTFTWTYSHPTNSAQATGRLRIYPEGSQVLLYDSGIRPGSYLSQQLPINLLQNNSVYQAQVTVTDETGGIGMSDRIRFYTEWEGPPQPDNIRVTPMNDQAVVLIEWDMSESEEFMAYRVYRRDPSDVTPIWVMIDEISDLNTLSYNYHFAPHDTTYQYSVTVVGDIMGAYLESSIDEFAETSLFFPHRTILTDRMNPEFFELILDRNPSRSENFEREHTVLQALGREKPTTHYGRSYSEIVSVSFSIKLPYEDIIKELKAFIARGQTILYRDGRGRRMWIALAGYDLQEELPNQARLSLECRTVYAQER